MRTNTIYVTLGQLTPQPNNHCKPFRKQNFNKSYNMRFSEEYNQLSDDRMNA